MSVEQLILKAELQRPDVTEQDAVEILYTDYGLNGRMTELGSQQDRNFRIENGTDHHVLKICRTDYAQVELQAQNAALHHLANKKHIVDEPLLRLPNLINSRNGSQILPLHIRGENYQARLFGYLDGEILTSRKHLSAMVVAAFGSIAARIDRDLADFDHPGLHRETQWDLRQAEKVLPYLLQSVTDKNIADRINNAMAGVIVRLAPLRDDLRIQAIHNDITDDNVVSRKDADGLLIPDGVIDFGDIVQSWLVAELAVTCAALLHHSEGDPFYILPAIKAYHAIYPLNHQELRALWPLIVARGALLTASSEQQRKVDPDNAYVAGNAEHEWAIFSVATSVPMELMEAAIFYALGIEHSQPALGAIGHLLLDIDVEKISGLDLSVTSTEFAANNWSLPDIETQLLKTAARETGAAATRYGEFRLTRTQVNNTEVPESFALYVDLCLPAKTRFFAPFNGFVEHRDGHITLVGDVLQLHLDGLDCSHEPDAMVVQGEVLGIAADGADGLGVVRVQLCRMRGYVPPLFAKPHHASAWSSLCPSPAALLGFACDAPSPVSATLLNKRYDHLAGTQKHYYQAPPQIERGWKEHMYDVYGRAYLDMVNNVTMIGHGHPCLAEAVQRQWLMLNTNSRFHYAAVAEFSERLAAKAPESIDTVFLVNSGSEANDLALRLAWAWSGHKNMLCLLEAYHGWTIGSDAVSTSTADNPNALGTRPDWVHSVVSPNIYRGKVPVTDYITAVVNTLQSLDEKGEKLAGFICEPVYGNAGGVVLPPNYLAEVYAHVRARGGLCIADEVQVGYGRLGHYFWAFEEQGVIPDIITIAKGMGNGHPLGAVITRREIADALENEGYFFSSAGGSPVSCVVGNSVLDILDDEGLQQNACLVGDHLKKRLQTLSQRFPLIGAVHGMGLYLGVEFVRDHHTLEPATEETTTICERMLDLGIIMQPTGDHLNVLKIKPPLCLSYESADYFADILERILGECC